MKFLVRYWYLIGLAFFMSLVSAVGLLYLRRDVWIAPMEKVSFESSDLTGMSVGYRKWNYQIAAVEDLRVSLQAERELFEARKKALEIEGSRIEAEKQNLVEMRKELDRLRETIQSEILRIEEAELDNIKRLAKVYEVMKSDAAAGIFKDLDIELVVKIMSKMGEEPVSRILAEMSQGDPESPEVKRAVKITEIIQKVM